MASARSIKQRLREYLAGAETQAISEAVWLDLLTRLAPVSESAHQFSTNLAAHAAATGKYRHGLRKIR